MNYYFWDTTLVYLSISCLYLSLFIPFFLFFFSFFIFFYLSFPYVSEIFSLLFGQLLFGLHLSCIVHNFLKTFTQLIIDSTAVDKYPRIDLHFTQLLTDDSLFFYFLFHFLVYILVLYNFHSLASSFLLVRSSMSFNHESPQLGEIFYLYDPCLSEFILCLSVTSQE